MDVCRLHLAGIHLSIAEILGMSINKRMKYIKIMDGYNEELEKKYKSK